MRPAILSLLSLMVMSTAVGAAESGERTRPVSDSFGRTLVVYPTVKWRWEFRFEAMRAQSPAVQQERGGITLVLTRIEHRVLHDGGQLRIEFQIQGSFNPSLTRLVEARLEAPGVSQTVAGPGARATLIQQEATGRFEFSFEQMPERFTLSIVANQLIAGPELTHLQEVHGALIPGEISYATALATAKQVLARVKGPDWGPSDELPATAARFLGSPAYQFAMGEASRGWNVLVDRFTGEVLGVQNLGLRSLLPPGTAPEERIWEFLKLVWPALDRARAVADDPPSTVTAWDGAGRESRRYGWFVPSAAEASGGDHFAVDTDADGQPVDATRLVDTTPNRPSVSFETARTTASAFLASQAVDLAGYTITEADRVYHSGPFFWPADRGRPALTEPPLWRFSRLLEFRPEDVSKETHWIWVDAHSGEVRDWFPTATPTPEQRAAAAAASARFTAPTMPAPETTDPERARYEALLQRGPNSGDPAYSFEELLQPLEASPPPMDFDEFVSLIPTPVPPTTAPRPSPDPAATLGFTALYPLLPPDTITGYSVRKAQREEPIGTPIEGTTWAVAVYFASPTETFFYLGCKPELAPALDGAQTVSIVPGISGAVGTLRGVPAVRADFPGCTAIVVGRQDPAVWVERFRHAVPAASAGELAGEDAPQTWIIAGVQPDTMGPVFAGADGGEPLVIESVSTEWERVRVHARVPTAWAKEDRAVGQAIHWWVVDATGRLWGLDSMSGPDAQSGTVSARLSVRRGLSPSPSPEPKAPFLVILRHSTFSPTRTAHYLSWLPMAGRELRTEPVPHWHATLRLEHLRVGTSGQRAAGAGAEYQVQETVADARAGKQVVGVAYVIRKSEPARRMNDFNGVTLIDDPGRRWPTDYMDSRGLFKTQSSGGTWELSGGAWTFPVEQVPAEFAVEIDLVGELEAPELAAVAWRNSGPIAPGERTVFELIDAARPVLARLGLPDTEDMKFLLGRADVSRSGQSLLEFRALLEGRDSVSVALDRRTGEVTRIYGSAGLFPARAGDNAARAVQYRDLLFRPADGVTLVETSHAAEEGHGPDYPASVMYFWQGRLADGRWTQDRVVVSVHDDGSFYMFNGERHQGPYPVVNLTAAQARAAAEDYLRTNNKYPTAVHSVTVTEEYLQALPGGGQPTTFARYAPLRYAFKVHYDLGMKPYMGSERPDFLEVYVDTETGAVLRAEGPGYR